MKHYFRVRNVDQRIQELHGDGIWPSHAARLLVNHFFDAGYGFYFWDLPFPLF